MNSIKRRLVAALLISLVTLQVGGSVAVYVFTRTILFQDFDQMLRAAERDTLSILTRAILENRSRDEEIMLEMRRDPPLYIQAWTKQGRVLARSAYPQPVNFDFIAATQDTVLADVRLPANQPGRGWVAPRRLFPFRDRAPRPGGEVVRHEPSVAGGGPGTANDRMADEIILMIAADTREVALALTRLQRVLAIVGIVMIAVVVAIANFVTGRGLTPVRRVADQASRIDATNLNLRFPSAGVPAELLPICDGLNGLLARLQEAFERERRFTADVAHELRTPIAELRSLSEVALKWPETDPAAMSCFRDTLEISLQMQAIVTGLLAIARCEAGTQVIACETVDLAALFRRLWEPHGQKAVSKSISCALNLPQTRPVCTDPGMLQVIIGNLCSNAVDYTPPGGAIQVSLNRDGSGLDFRVNNSVNNLTPDDLPHLKERFWRKDSARSSSEHSGIGLSVADAFARALGMQLEPSFTSNGLLQMRLVGAPSPPAQPNPA